MKASWAGHLTAMSVHHLVYQQLRETIEVGLRGAEALRRAGLLWFLVDNLYWTSFALFHTGRLEEAAGTWHELGPLIRRLGHTVPVRDDYYEFALDKLMRTGDIDAYELAWRNILERGRSRQHSVAISQGHVNLGIVSFWKGHWHEGLDNFEAALKVEPPGAFAGFAAAYTLLAKAYMGDREGALAVLHQKGFGAAPQTRDRPATSLLFPMVRAARSSGLGLRGLFGLIRESRTMRKRGPLPRPGRSNTFGSWMVLFAGAEGLAVLGERRKAAKLYTLVMESMRTGNLFRGFDNRLLDTLAGIAAACGGKWDQAEEHFRTALRRSEELPHVIEQPEVRRFYARMLLDRNAPGDREKAGALLNEAVEMYRRIGMPKHVEMAEAMLRESGG